MSVYQSYFARYAGQTLHVRASRERAPDDFIVNTDMVGGGQPMQIDFRVRTDGAKPLLVDFAVEGVWLSWPNAISSFRCWRKTMAISKP